MLLAGLVLPCVGCAGNSGLNGKWLGSVMEKGKPTQCSLDLRTQGDAIGGTLTILSDTGDTKAGTSFAIYNARRSDNKLEFVVPVSGELDSDSVFFELFVQKDRLEGFGREMRQGSTDLPAVFVKQK
jgi:hypothetical protein